MSELRIKLSIERDDVVNYGAIIDVSRAKDQVGIEYRVDTYLAAARRIILDEIAKDRAPSHTPVATDAGGE